MDKEPICKLDSNGNVIYYKYISGFESWWEYDSNDNLIHYKNSTGLEKWWEYDSDGQCIHYKNNLGLEEWYWEGKEAKDPVKILLLASKLHSEVPQ